MAEAEARPGLSGYDAGRPLALLTDYPPDTQGGGAVILRSLLGPEERGRIVWMSPAPPLDPARAGPNVVTLEAGSSGRRGRRSIVLDSTVYATALAREAAAVARARGARAFWVLMHHAGVAIAARLARAGDFPLHLTVHDDPAFGVALRSRRYLGLVPLIERDFARAIRGARSVDVIGRGMADRYRRRYGVESVVVHRAMEGAVEAPGPYDAGRLGLRVGVLGSTYAYEPLPILARAVELAAGRLGVPGRLLVLGRSYGERLRDEFAGRVEVEVAGHVAEDGAVPMLRDCFMLYLNYPFGRRDAVLRRTSFPTKLSTYLRAARPLLVHAPGDSSVSPLAGPDGFAIAWESNDPARGADALAVAWGRAENHEGRQVEAERARLAFYDPGRNRRDLFDALDALPGPDPR